MNFLFAIVALLASVTEGTSRKLVSEDVDNARLQVHSHRRLGSYIEEASKVTPDGVAKFKKENQLKDDADPIVQELHTGGIVYVGGEYISLNPRALEPVSVFTDNPVVIVDGFEREPLELVFKSKQDPRFHAAFDENGQFLSGTFFDHKSGESVAIQPVQEGTTLFANVENDDLDDKVMSQFDIASPHGRGLRAKTSAERARGLQDVGACSTRGFDIVEIAVVVDSTFCEGSTSSRAQADVEAALERASDFYEIDGLCKKLKIKYIEVNCERNRDPVQDFLVPATRNCGGTSLLDGFVGYVQGERIDADLNILVHGKDFGTTSIGCAYLSTVCNRNGYDSGVNYMRFNPNTLQRAKLVAHEMAHIMGADHVSDQDDIMASTLCSNCGGDSSFGATSRGSINRVVQNAGCTTLESGGGGNPTSTSSPTTTTSRPTTTTTRSTTTTTTRTTTTTTTGGSNGDSMNIMVKVLHDNYPEETAWTLKDSSGTSIIRQRLGDILQPGEVNQQSANVAKGTYTFKITDTERDGICCSYGVGKIEIYVDGQLVKSHDGDFGRSLSLEFGPDTTTTTPNSGTCTDSPTFVGQFGIGCSDIKFYTSRSQRYICRYLDGFNEECSKSCGSCR